MNRTEGRRQSIAAALLIAAGAVAFWYFRIIRPAWNHPFIGNLGNVDFFTQIYPMSFRGAAWIRQGIVPLWNPYQFAGHPFLAAALYGVCYPPNVLYLFLPTAVAIEAIVVLHLALSGWFTYRYAAVVGLPPLARFAGAATYMFCGFMANQAGWFTPAISSSTWLPLALIAVERIVDRRDTRSAALLAAAVALALLGGWTQFWVYTMYVIGLYAAARVAASAWRGATRAQIGTMVVLLGLAIGLGVAVTAVQLLPTRELQVLGPRRPGGLTTAQLVPFVSLSPRRLMSEALDWRTARPFIAHFYFGPIVLALVGLSLLSTRNPVSLGVMWVVLVASYLVSIALNTPFFEHVYLHLPAARWFRLPQRICFLLAFSAAVLAAFGTDALGNGPPARRVPTLVVGIGILVCGAVFLVGRPPLPAVELALIGIAACAFGGAILAQGTRQRTRLSTLVVLVAIADLVHGANNVFRHPIHGVEVLHRQDAILDYVREHQGLDRTYLHDSIGFDFSITQKQGTLHEIYSVGDYEPLSLLRFAELFDLIGISRAIAPSTVYFPFTGYLNVDPRSPHRAVLDVLSLRYWVVGRMNRAMLIAMSAPGSPWHRVPGVATKAYVLFEHATPLPRAYVATHAVIVPDGAASLAAIAASDFDPRRSVVVESAVGLPPPPRGSSESPTSVTPAHITSYEPREVRIEADVAAPGYLVLTDTYYPGWKATVDGVPVPIYAGNHVVRAVPVESGHHLVTLRYEPMSVKLGAFVSAISLVAICALAAVGGLPG